MNEDVEEREEEFRSNGNINDYVILKPIGKGKFATVYRAKRVADQRPVALKKIHAFEELDEKKRVKCLKEVRLLQSLQHRHIISYMDSFVCDGSLVIVSEWAEAGDLKRQIRKLRQKGARFHEHVIWKYFLQIAEALKHMHSRRVMHRDLKPANIFLTAEADVKVGDLGLGRHFSDETMEAFSKVGTPLYMSPEVLKGKGYGWKSDIWSLGCILYELATLRSPFKEPGLNLYGLFKKIGKGEFEPIPKMFSNDIRQLCNRMISLDVRNRPDADEVCKLAREMCEKTAKDLEDVKQRRASAKEAAIRATAKTSGGSMEIVLGRLSLLRYQERVLLRNHFLGPLLLSPCGRRAKNDGGSVGTMGPHHWSMQFANFVCVVQFLLEHLGEKLLEVADIDAIRKLMSELGDMDFRRHRWDHSRMTVGMRVLLALGRVGFSKDEIMARALTPQSLMYGYGPQIVRVLDMLTKKVCKKVSVNTTPNYDDNEDDIQVVEEDEVTSAQEMTFEDEMSEDSINVCDQNEDSKHNHDIIKSSIDASKWKLEVTEAIEMFRDTSLEGIIRPAGSRLLDLTNSILSQKLVKIGRDVSLWSDQVLSPDLKSLVMLESRLNSACSNSLSRVKDTTVKSQALSSRIRKVRNSVSDASERLSEISDVLEDLYERIEDRQREINEVSVLSEARKSIRLLRNEIVNMDVRIGYLRGELMRHRAVSLLGDNDNSVDDGGNGNNSSSDAVEY